MKRNLQGELRQGLVVVKLPAAFWESNSRCYNFCSTAFTFLAHLEMSTLAKSVLHPLGWSRGRGAFCQELCQEAAHSIPKNTSSSPGIFTSPFAGLQDVAFICGLGRGEKAQLQGDHYDC